MRAGCHSQAVVYKNLSLLIKLTGSFKRCYQTPDFWLSSYTTYIDGNYPCSIEQTYSDIYRFYSYPVVTVNHFYIRYNNWFFVRCAPNEYYNIHFCWSVTMITKASVQVISSVSQRKSSSDAYQLVKNKKNWIYHVRNNVQNLHQANPFTGSFENYKSIC